MWFKLFDFLLKHSKTSCCIRLVDHIGHCLVCGENVLMEIFISWVTILEGFNPYAEWIFITPASGRAHFNFLGKFDHFYFDVGLRFFTQKVGP